MRREQPVLDKLCVKTRLIEGNVISRVNVIDLAKELPVAPEYEAAWIPVWTPRHVRRGHAGSLKIALSLRRDDGVLGLAETIVSRRTFPRTSRQRDTAAGSCRYPDQDKPIDASLC